MEWLIEAPRNANNFNLALIYAAQNGKISAMEWLINHGASNLDAASMTAMSTNQQKAYRWLQERINRRY